MNRRRADILHNVIKKLFILLILVFGISTIVVSLRRDTFPKTFTLNVSSDLTNVGRNQTYAASIKFQNGKLVNGISRYVVDSGINGRFAYDCVAKGPEWVYADSHAVCDIPVSIPLTRVAIQQEIEKGKMKPETRCGHMDICYDIVSE